MEHIQSWSPDTCGCSLHTALDKDLPDVPPRYVTPEEAADIFEAHQLAHPERTLTLSKSQWRDTFPAKLCAAHSVHGHTQARHDIVLEENQRKNKVVNLLGDKTGTRPSEFRFAFDVDRILSVSHPSLDSGAVHNLQTALDQVHGQGKVRLSNG